MKRVSWNLKKGEIRIKVESLDDRWTLKQVISQGDLVSGKGERKIKKGGKDERTRAVIKMHFRALLEAEKVEFNAESSQLRISGKLMQGTEDIPKGSYHTITLELRDGITIKKHHWPDYQLRKLKDATNSAPHKILLALFDREEALIALLKRRGYEIIRTLQGEVQKKRMKQAIRTPFFEEIKKSLKELAERYKITHIIVASPAFWKDEIRPFLEKAALPKLIFAQCSSVSRNGIGEVLKRPEIASALKEERVLEEFAAVEEIMAALAKGNPVAYGLKEIKRAAEAGAIARLVVADTFLQEHPASDDILRSIEKQRGRISIISTSHEGGKKLLGLGGIGAILRYAVR